MTSRLTRLGLPIATALALTLLSALLFVHRGGAETAATGAALQVSAWARATAPGAKVGAGYLTVENAGPPDRLISAETPVAERVALHSSEIVDAVARMRAVPEGFAVETGSTLEMRPGGAHLMLEGLKTPLKEGDVVPLTLRFERAGDVRVDARVAPLGASEAPAVHQHH